MNNTREVEDFSKKWHELGIPNGCLSQMQAIVDQQLQNARIDWLRSEIEKLEGMKDDYPVDAQPTTKEHEMRINWANPVAHQALTSIITRYKEELLELETRK